MGDETARMSWLSGRPQRVLSLRRPPAFADRDVSFYARWSVMDDQILLILPSAANATSPSTIYLADILAGLESPDNVVEFRQIVQLSFRAASCRLLSNRAGFVTVELKEKENLTLRTHDWAGNVVKEKQVPADSMEGGIAVNGSSVALCVGHGLQPLTWCGSTKLKHIAIWETESGDLTMTEIPQDERGPQCHRGNFQFATPSYIALGGHIDPCYDRPYAVLRSFPITPSEQKPGRYFHQHENFEYDHNHDAIAIPGSSTSNNVIVHHHHHMNRFTVADVGLLTGEIPSEALPSPGYFVDPDYHKDLFHVFSDKTDARTLPGSIHDGLASIEGNRLLVREYIDDYEHEQDQYRAFKTPNSAFGTFQVLYLYDFDQDRCKALRQLSSPEREALEARLKELNPEARVTVVSRMFYTSIEEEEDTEKDESPEWKARVRKVWETQWAREKGEAEFPVLEYDDPPEGQDNPRMLFTRTMICLPKMKTGEMLALTTSAIVELPLRDANGYVHYFGKE